MTTDTPGSVRTGPSVEPDPAPDPEAGRNGDQHRALRDD